MASITKINDYDIQDSRVDNLATVATSGSYSDLSNKPSIPSVPNNNDLLKIMYPVGSVYLTINNTNPSTWISGTTWVLVGSKLAVRENVFGNGYALALKSSTGAGRLQTSDGYAGFNNGWGVGVGAQGYNKTNIGNQNTAVGVPTKSQVGSNPEYSGLIVDTETIYSWKRTV